MNEQASSSERPSGRVDPAPVRWALMIVALLALLWGAFQIIGTQRFHNTAFWQRLHPVVLTSPPQTVQRVDAPGKEGAGPTMVQTERGVYFLSGSRYVPVEGQTVIVQANDDWQLYLCAHDGGRCMTIHSFCADRTLDGLVRDEQGRIEGCYAPNLSTQPRSTDRQADEEKASGPGKKFKRTPPAVGTSHPREWAWRMGLPVPAGPDAGQQAQRTAEQEFSSGR